MSKAPDKPFRRARTVRPEADPRDAAEFIKGAGEDKRLAPETTRVNFDLEKAVYKQLQRRAFEDDEKIAVILRRLVDTYLNGG